MCKSWDELIFAIVIIVFALWESVYATWGKWVLVIAGVLLLIHAFTCPRCFPKHEMEMKMPAKKKRR